MNNLCGIVSVLVSNCKRLLYVYYCLKWVPHKFNNSSILETAIYKLIYQGVYTTHALPGRV